LTLYTEKRLVDVDQAVTILMCTDLAPLTVHDLINHLLILVKADAAAKLCVFDRITGVVRIVD
jgi:hypothetical protein